MSYPHEMMHNNVRLLLVGIHPVAKTAFYANNGHGGVIGVRIYPDGKRLQVNPCFLKLSQRKKRDKKEGYLVFRHAWGHQIHILASHAVYIAWRGQEIPAGMTIDHINGVTTDNRIENLRCVTGEINSRDGGFLMKLRNKNFHPETMTMDILLRYYTRMALIKRHLTSYQYRKLDWKDLFNILYYTSGALSFHLQKKYNTQIQFQL